MLKLCIAVLVICVYSEGNENPKPSKLLPTSLQTMGAVINENKIYVDKTDFAYELITNGGHFIMTRPRRFGKSLFLDMLREILEGNRELFNEFAIGKTNYAWEKYAVLYIDFSAMQHDRRGILEKGMEHFLLNTAKSRGIIIEGFDVCSRLKSLVEQLSTAINKNKKVAILVDEYDAPIIANLHNPELAEENINVLKNLFSTLKSLQKYIRFTFVMGITKFSLVSLSSGANYLDDISMDSKFSSMIGFTKSEIETNFKNWIEYVAKLHSTFQKNITKENILNELKDWYDGYHFSKDISPETSVYNPWSTVQYFNKREARQFWIATGPSSFLINALSKFKVDELLNVAIERNISVSEITLLSPYDINTIHWTTLLFQTGYLTILEYSAEKMEYFLYCPNKEVKECFFHDLCQVSMKTEPRDIKAKLKGLEDDLHRFDFDAFFQKIDVAFASIPSNLYHPSTTEKSFHIALHLMLRTVDIPVKSEYTTHKGSIDMLLETKNSVYIFEIKASKPPSNANDAVQKALEQIKTNEYMKEFLQDNKIICAVGLVFDTKDRKIYWKIKYYSTLGEEMEKPKAIK